MQAVNSFRIAVNKIPFQESEDVRAIVSDVLHLLDCSNEISHLVNCFRLPVKPSKWSDREITPTIIIVFDEAGSRQHVLKNYFQNHWNAKLCNLRNGPALEYRFTMNEVLSMRAFRTRNYALRLKQQKLLKSVFIRNDRVSVLFPGQKRYVSIDDCNHLRELVEHKPGAEDSSVFFDAKSSDISTSSRC